MGQLNPHQPIFAAASPEIYTKPYPIIGPQYCVPYPVDIAIVRKFMSVTDGSFVVNDIADNLMFKVKEKLISLHKRRTVLDPYDNPIVTVTKKVHTISSSFPYFIKCRFIYCTFIPTHQRMTNLIFFFPLLFWVTTQIAVDFCA